MPRYREKHLPWLAVWLAAIPAVALADGGAILAREQAGGLLVTVFASPLILTAGKADLSVLALDARTHSSVADSKVLVTISPREHSYLAQRYEASSQLATNQLFKSCEVILESGWNDVRVEVDSELEEADFTFAMLVGAEPRRAAVFWPWFAWPAVPVVLFGANHWYARLRRPVRL